MPSGTIYKSAFVAALLALAACATSPEDEQRRKDMEADIDEIMSYELDKTEFGETKNCLSKNEFRSFRALGDRHLLFEGRNDKQWVNVLRGRWQRVNFTRSRHGWKPARNRAGCSG